MRRIVFFILMICSSSAFAQMDTVSPYQGLLKGIDCDENAGLDSTGKRQGNWCLSADFILYELYPKETLVETKGTEIGFYVDDNKEGIWDIYGEKGNLIAQRLYQNDSILYEIHYKNKQITAIIKWAEYSRPNNQGIVSRSYMREIIRFDKKGRIQKREFIAPDGIPEKRIY